MDNATNTQTFLVTNDIYNKYKDKLIDSNGYYDHGIFRQYKQELKDYWIACNTSHVQTRI